ncbi:MAG: redoxin domain-containing protein [Gemmatimonadota bacterium]
MTLEIGDTAPAFALPAAPGETVDVGALFGREKVVLLFFPLAFSRVCTSELCAVRDQWTRWHDLGTRVFAISVDSPFVTARFRAEQELPFPVLSDFDKQTSRAYGVLYEEFFGLHGVAKRSAFVVGRDGKVAYRWVSEDSGVEPDYDALRDAVGRAP